MAASDCFIDSLKQQKIPSHHISFGPTFVFSLTFFLGVLCIGIGIVLTHAASSIKEQVIDYTNRTNEIVELSVNLTEFEGNVFVYYQLERFPQLHYSMRNSYDINHFMEGDYSYQCTGETEFQRWMKSFTDHWMRKIFSFLFPQSDSAKRIPPLVPCGHRANFFFNDTLGKIYDPNKNIANFTRKNIAWPKIRECFKNNEMCNSSDLCSCFNTEKGERYPKPANWKRHICEMENGMENEDFIVWMAPAYATTFRKLWSQFIKKDQVNGSMYETGLPNGIYTFSINNTWKIRNNVYGNYLFNKSIVFSTANWAGGKNNFLGYAYLIVGVTILLFSCGLAIMQSIKPSYIVYETEEHIRRRKSE